MESFNELLHKLQEVHEQETEVWQEKVLELSNKKGCDSKRMEELFTRNQQMREHQRLLTENIQSLENRLRAGLCDRCTVTQDVAKRRQQEYEASQIQSLQHISILAGEMNNLRKDNKRLREEVHHLRGVLMEGHSEHSSNSTTPEVKTTRSPNLSPSNGPVALIITATGRAPSQSTDGAVAVKSEPDQQTEELSERRQLRPGWNRGHFESFKPLSWKTDSTGAAGGAAERRTRSVEGPDQRSQLPPSIPPHVLLLKSALLPCSSSSSSAPGGGELKPMSRHVLHAPVPCRPHPMKSAHVSLPWPLPEASEWVTLQASSSSAAGGESLVVVQQQQQQPGGPPKLGPLRFPNLIPTSQHIINHHGAPGAAQGRRPVVGHVAWHKHSPPQQALSKEQALVFRVRSILEAAQPAVESVPPANKTPPAAAVEKREMAPPQWKSAAAQQQPERAVREGQSDAPLDLSDRGCRLSEPKLRLVVREGPREGEGGEGGGAGMERVDPSAHAPAPRSSSSSSSCSPPAPPSSSSPSSSVQQQPGRGSAEQPGRGSAEQNQNHKQGEEQAEKEETAVKTDVTSNGRKVPVLTISLRPVVLLETLNAGLQRKAESSSSNGKQSSSTADPGSSSDGPEGEEGEDSSQGSKRKRAVLDTDTERDSDPDAMPQMRKVTIRVGPQEKSPSNHTGQELKDIVLDIYHN